VRRIPLPDLCNEISVVLGRVTVSARLQVTVDQAVSEPVAVENIPTWTPGARAHDVIISAQTDSALARELNADFAGHVDQF
jgi:hypothetical protein